ARKRLPSAIRLCRKGLKASFARVPVRGRERAAGGLSILAGLGHVAAVPSHAAVWWAYAVFFLAAALAQVLLGLLLLTQGIEGGGGWPAWRRRVCWAGIAGNVALLALWAVTRTVGVPLGPEAGEVEAVGGLDLGTKLLELATVAVLASLLAGRRG